MLKKKAVKAVEAGTGGRTIKTLQQTCISVRFSPPSPSPLDLLLSAVLLDRPSSPFLPHPPSRFPAHSDVYTPQPQQVIGAHINNVEALGDIGPKNLDRVAQIVCKNRALTPENLSLFLEVGHTELRLYDCTSESVLLSLLSPSPHAPSHRPRFLLLPSLTFLTPAHRTDLNDTSLSTLPIFCPRLERLTLNLCGRLDDDVLKEWGKGFKELKYLSLYGECGFFFSSSVPDLFELVWEGAKRTTEARAKREADEWWGSNSALPRYLWTVEGVPRYVRRGPPVGGLWVTSIGS